MAATQQPVVVGVFGDDAVAQRAIAELRHAGFRDDQIQLFTKSGSSGGVFEHLLDKIAGHEEATASGSIVDSLTAKGIPEEDAKYYQQEYEAGRAIVAVETYGHQQEADDILYRFGAYNARTNPHLEQVQTVQLREEVLQPQKRPVEVGQVYIRKVVVTEQKTITVQVNREDVIIERRPVSDQAAGQPAPLTDQSLPLEGRLLELAEGETIRIPLRQEQVVIEKRPVVVEELVVGKKKVEETQQFTDTVLREVPRIERQGDVTVHSSGLDVQDVTDQLSA